MNPSSRISIVWLLAVAAIGGLPFAACGQGTTQVIAFWGNAPPDGNGTFRRLSYPDLNSNGQTAFFAELAGTTGESSDNGGIYRTAGAGGPLTLVARERSAGLARSGLTDIVADTLPSAAPALNASGEVAFLATYVQPHFVGGATFRGVYRGSGGPLTAIAAEADISPDGNGRFLRFDDLGPRLNDAGEIAFWAELTNTNDGANDNEGLFRGAGGAVSPIARKGEAAPDGNGSYSSFFDLELNSAGQTMFGAQFDGTVAGDGDDLGIFRDDGVDIVQVAREGQPLAGGIVTSLTYFSITSGASGNTRNRLNDSSRVAYWAEINGHDHAIALFSLLGEFQPGDFDHDGDVDGDDFLIWQSSYGQDDGGDADGDNDTDGDDFLLWQSNFGNTSGGGASATVPEPGSLALAILVGMFGLVAARLRR